MDNYKYDNFSLIYNRNRKPPKMEQSTAKFGGRDVWEESPLIGGLMPKKICGSGLRKQASKHSSLSPGLQCH